LIKVLLVSGGVLSRPHSQLEPQTWIGIIIRIFFGFLLFEFSLFITAEFLDMLMKKHFTAPSAPTTAISADGQAKRNQKPTCLLDIAM